MDIQVGDKITYKSFYGVKTEIILRNQDVDNLIEDIKNGNIKIIKIERPHYEVVEEKKELLTEEEREFLRDMCKYYKNVSQIIFIVNIKVIKLCNKAFYAICGLDYPDNMDFDNIKADKYYTLRELGLEEN